MSTREKEKEPEGQQPEQEQRPRRRRRQKPEGPTEQEKILAWRAEQFTRELKSRGVHGRTAKSVADKIAKGDADRVQVIRALDNGCTPRLLARIFS